MEAIVPAEAGEGGGGWAQDSHGIARVGEIFCELGAEHFGEVFRWFFLRAAHDDADHRRVRRVEKFLALGQGMFGERLVVVREGVVDRGVLGARGLHEDAAASVAAAGAPGDLGDELEGSLGGTEVGEVQRGVGVDHAYKRHVGEVEAFGDHLRAEEDVDFVIAETHERSLVAARFLHRVGVHPQDTGVREPRFYFPFELLRAEAGEFDLVATAIRAFFRCGGFVVAVMAHGLVARFVMRERNVAVGALNRCATGGALDRRRVPAAVEQQNHLALRRERLVDRAFELQADCAAHDALAVLVAEVDHVHIGHRAPCNADGHRDNRRAAALNFVPRFEGGRRRAKDQRHAFADRALLRDGAGVVTWRRALLKARVMLLVDHDDAEVRRRGENRASGADNDLHFACADALPVTVTVDVGQVAVKDRDLIEPGAETLDRLRREANFGHEDDRLAAELHD